MRITTNQILSNYQTGLQNSAAQLNADRTTVLTQRKFQKVSEDPASAAKAFQLRKEFIQNENHITNVDAVMAQYEAAYDSGLQINDMLKETKSQMLKGMNGASSFESRQTLATSIKKMQESVVASANAKFGDNFILGGQNISSPPFKLGDDNQLQFTANGTDYLDVSSDDPATQAALKEFSEGKSFVDLGFGLAFDGGELVENTAFNTSISGLEMLGFGTKDGVSINVIDAMGQFATELEKEFPDEELLGKTMRQFDESSSDMLDFITQISTSASFLETTKSRLEDTQLTLNEKIVDIESIDIAEAITNFSWSEFAYNQALKIGNSILSQSFIDFMK